jgi:hypothetical protein
MRRWLLAAGLIAAAAASPALAADIDGVPPPPGSGPYYGGPYGGPYSGPYGGDPRYTPQRPPPQSYDDDDDDDRDDRAPPRRYSYAPPRHQAPPPARHCVRSEDVRDRLTREGWRDFHDGKPVSDVLVTLRARQPNGRLFELTLQRCTGELLNARALELKPFGPYAYRQPYGPYGPWRWGAPTAPYAYEDEGWQDRPYAERSPPPRRWNRE